MNAQINDRKNKFKKNLSERIAASQKRIKTGDLQHSHQQLDASQQVRLHRPLRTALQEQQTSTKRFQSLALLTPKFFLRKNFFYRYVIDNTASQNMARLLTLVSKHILMKYYLSSHKIGGEAEKLREMIGDKKIAFIPNSLDYIEPEARSKSNKTNMQDLIDLGINVEMLDLKDYFGKQDNLKKEIKNFGGVWIRGGNTFVLRQAMRLSGFDELISRMDSDDFIYGGYSAGICVLAPSLKAIQQVDDPTIMPYEESDKIIWEGLGLLDYIILPHYKSDHHESAMIDKVVEYCKQNNIPFKTLRDGEVIILEQ